MSVNAGFISRFIERNPRLSVCLLAILGFLFMMFWGGMKSSYAFHVDEMWQYSFANSYGGDTRVITDADLGRWLSPNLFRDYYTVQPSQRFSYAQVVRSAELDLHPPFSHLLLNTVCSFFPDKFSKWYGLSINIAAYLASLVALYGLGTLLFANRSRALAGAAVWGFSLAAVDTVMYIRMYCLLTLFSICLFFCSVQFMRSGSKRWLFGLFFCTVLGGLTEYIFWILGFFTTASFVLFNYRKNLKLAVQYAAVSLLAFLSACLVFPATIMQFLNKNSMTHQANEMFDLQSKLTMLVNPVYALKRFLHFSSSPLWGISAESFWNLLGGVAVLIGVFLVVVLTAAIISAGRRSGAGLSPEQGRSEPDVLRSQVRGGLAVFAAYMRGNLERLLAVAGRRKPLLFVITSAALTTYTLAVVFPNFLEWTVRAFFFVFPLFSLLLTAGLVFLHTRAKIPVGIIVLIMGLIMARAQIVNMSPFLQRGQYEKLHKKLKDANVIVALESEKSYLRMPNFCPPLSEANGAYVLLLNKPTVKQEMMKAIRTATPGHKLMIINTVAGPPDNIAAAAYLGPELLLNTNGEFLQALGNEGLGIKLVKKFGRLFQTFNLYEILPVK